MQSAKKSTPKNGKTRRARVEQKEEVIVDAARHMFMENGFSGTRMSGIAKRAGVADGTLYLYFENKEALARTVVTDFYGRLTNSAQEGVDQLSTTEERLRFLARHHLTNCMRERRVLEMLPLLDLEMDSYGGSELFALNKNYVAIFDRIAKDGQASGRVNQNITPWVLRDIFYGAMDYGSRTMLLRDRPEDIDIFINDLMQSILSNSIQEAPDQSLVERFENAASRIEKALGDPT